MTEKPAGAPAPTNTNDVPEGGVRIHKPYAITILVDRELHRALELMHRAVDPKDEHHFSVIGAYLAGRERVIRLEGAAAIHFRGWLVRTEGILGKTHPIAQLSRAIDRASGRRE